MKEVSEEEITTTISDIEYIQNGITESISNIQKLVSEMIDQVESIKKDWTTTGGIKSLEQIKNDIEGIGDLSSKKISILNAKINYTSIPVEEQM